MAGYTCHEAVLVNRLSLAECNRKSNYSGLKTGGVIFLSGKTGWEADPLNFHSCCPEFSLSRI